MTEKTFADRLKQTRNDRHYTQAQLAVLVDVATKTISNYEQGISEPITRHLLEIAKVLDVTPEYLLLGDNNMNTYTEAIKKELLQLTQFSQIEQIKHQELNAAILSHLEMSEELVNEVTSAWNRSGIFAPDSYCTRSYVQSVILRYCQNRTKFKQLFQLQDGMLLQVSE